MGRTKLMRHFRRRKGDGRLLGMALIFLFYLLALLTIVAALVFVAR